VNRPMSRREKRILILLGLLVFLSYVTILILVVNWLYLAPAAFQVEITSPPDGFIAREGETLIVEALATGKDLVNTELWVDEVPVGRVTSGPGEGSTTWSIIHSWIAQGQGQHRLSVKVYDVSGTTIASPYLAIGVVPSARVVFASDRSGGYDLYTMYVDGSELTQLTSGREQDRQPSCSGSGLVLFASSSIEGGTDIWLAQLLASTDPVILTGALGGDYSPRWSPDDETIAFISDRHGPSQLFLMNPDGSGQIQLTRENTYVDQPSWAPDGSSLLFSAKRDGNRDIYRVPLDGEAVSRLTDDPAEDWHPAWSPRGDQIAYVSNREGSHQLYIMQADGTQQRRLTAFQTGAEQPQWSPDGEWIIFVAYTGRGEGFRAREIYIMRPDGSDQMRLTDNSYDDTEPAWCH
jgi:Tol biopolymer transport system component